MTTILRSRWGFAAAGIAVLMAVISVAAVRRAEAFKAMTTSHREVDPKHMFGMVGLTRAETARVNIVNLGEPNRRGEAPAACDVEATFFDAMGNALMRQMMMIEGGQAAHLDLNGGLVGSPDGRPAVRAEVGFLNPCGPVASTLEVFDTATGQGNLILSPAVIKGFNPQPDPPGIGGAPGR